MGSGGRRRFDRFCDCDRGGYGGFKESEDERATLNKVLAEAMLDVPCRKTSA